MASMNRRSGLADIPNGMTITEPAEAPYGLLECRLQSNTSGMGCVGGDARPRHLKGNSMAEDKEKEEAIRQIEDAGAEAKNVESMGQAMIESARFVQDMAKPLATVFREFPTGQAPSGGWAPQIQGWSALNNMMSSFRGMQMNVNSFSVMAMSSANTAISGSVMMFGPTPPAVPPPPAVEAALTNIYQTLDRFPLIDKAIVSMRRLGLDRRGGDSRPALDLLNEARGAIQRPVLAEGGPVSVLIPLRECIGAAISELVRRRPQKEPGKKWSAKLDSLGSQCGLPSLASGHFTRLGNDADTLMDQLSGAKQTDMDRVRLTALFSRGLLLLNAILESIDESKLKPS
jgi:hypothetical protein